MVDVTEDFVCKVMIFYFAGFDFVSFLRSFAQQKFKYV